MKRPFDYDPFTGVTTTYEDTPEGFLLHYSQDATPFIEANKRAQNDNVTDRKSEMRHVAEIPMGVQYEWMTKYGVNFDDKNHWKKIKKLLNSNEYRWLKVRNVII